MSEWIKKLFRRRKITTTTKMDAYLFPRAVFRRVTIPIKPREDFYCFLMLPKSWQDEHTTILRQVLNCWPPDELKPIRDTQGEG